jgi:hypothetical protein
MVGVGERGYSGALRRAVASWKERRHLLPPPTFPARSNGAASREISFDDIFPYLLRKDAPLRPEQMALSLGLCRVYIDRINSGRDDVRLRKAVQASVGFPLPGTNQYRQLSQVRKKAPRTIADVPSIYLESVVRVGYRRDFLGSLPWADNRRKRQVLSLVDVASAYLLFDDDLFDFASDCRIGKITTLTLAARRFGLAAVCDEMAALPRMLCAIDSGSGISHFIGELYKCLTSTMPTVGN